MNKLHKNQFVAIIIAGALSSSLVACAPKKESKVEQTSEVSQTIVSEAVDKIDMTEIDKAVKTSTRKIKQRQADKTIEEYTSSLREEISNLGNYAKETWNSETVQTKYNNAKQKLTDLFNFVVNGEEINGITFKDLSDNGKEIAQNGLYELDGYLNKYIPNYKERFHDWTVDKGADVVELWDKIKNSYEEYKGEVTEEYNNRQRL